MLLKGGCRGSPRKEYFSYLTGEWPVMRGLTVLNYSNLVSHTRLRNVTRSEVPMKNKWVYLFSEGNADMRDLLGGKGAGVAEMTRAGVPVPPGFTITTEACNVYFDQGQFPDGLWEQVLVSVQKIEAQTGKTFGAVATPLLVSVRSGAKFSMPGMMDTVLNLGLNRTTLEGLAGQDGKHNRRFAQDAHRRFIQLYG